jgi:hypothetical protein
MTLINIHKIVEQNAKEKGLLKLFSVYVIPHDIYHSIHSKGLEKGWKKPENSFMITITNKDYNKKYDHPFRGKWRNHIDFTYDPETKLIRDTSTRVWSPLQGKGYGRKLTEAMEESAKDLNCIRIIRSNVINPGFLKHLKYTRFVDSEGEIHWIKDLTNLAS